MIANQFKTLGHTKRLEILSILRGHELTVSQIAQMTGLRQASVSQHLALLKHHRFVTTRPRGKEIYATLNSTTISTLQDALYDLAHTHSSAEPTVIDPVCQMSLTPHKARYTAEYDGVRHYFCGKGCLKDFSVLHKGAL